MEALRNQNTLNLNETKTHEPIRTYLYPKSFYLDQARSVSETSRFTTGKLRDLQQREKWSHNRLRATSLIVDLRALCHADRVSQRARFHSKGLRGGPVCCVTQPRAKRRDAKGEHTHRRRKIDLLKMFTLNIIVVTTERTLKETRSTQLDLSPRLKL